MRHHPDDCAGEFCVLHNPSWHHMRDWPTLIRTSGLVERICEHGVGHPDPDSVAYFERKGIEAMDVHGCDGCCTMEKTQGEYKHDNHVTPKVTVDIVIFPLNSDKDQCVMIQRKNPPHGWALPGGFVDIGETTMQAAIREAEEETGCRLTGVEQFHTYSDPTRDPRGHGITVVYIGYTIDEPEAADDAKAIGYFNFKDLTLYGPTGGTGTSSHIVIAKKNNAICFDHAQMLLDIYRFLKTNKRPTRE